jgi:hypothetical protein
MNYKGLGWDSHNPTRDPLIAERPTAGRFTVFPKPLILIIPQKGGVKMSKETTAAAFKIAALLNGLC